MAWETYYPDSPNMPEFSFVENTVSIELTDWKSIGILKNEFPLQNILFLFAKYTTPVS